MFGKEPIVFTTNVNFISEWADLVFALPIESVSEPVKMQEPKELL